MSDTPKRFEDWREVNCNDCQHYWDSSCDGASRGSKIGCNSYLATRSIVIPEKVNWLEKRVKQLEWEVIALSVCLSIALIALFYILG